MRRSANALQHDLLPEDTEWKQEASARLQAHRSRRAGQPGGAPSQEETAAPRDDRHARIAQSVAERYAQAQSYSHYLEQAAAAAPPVKQRPAATGKSLAAKASAPVKASAPSETSAVAADFVLAGDQANTVIPTEAQRSGGTCLSTAAGIAATPLPEASTQQQEIPTTGYLSLAVSIAVPEGLPAFPGTDSHATNAVPQWQPQPEDLAHTPIEPEMSIPGNLIEFPRQLIAPRKARPRIAEGPLLDPAVNPGPEAPTSQLRIFEVEPDLISREPLASALVAPPDWHSIQLDTQPAAAHDVPAPTVTPEQRVAPRNASPIDLPLQVAPLSRRMMAGIVDTSLIVLGFSTFAASAFAITPHPPTVEVAAIATAAVFGLFYIGYYGLFCTLADATPGMRYARVALCTFGDANPTRREMRWRLAAYVLSGATLGLGLLWSLVDDDHLGWHDRMSRTYQRCY